MPTYDYFCSECQHELEAFQKITESPLRQCPQCGKEALIRRPGGGIGLSFSGGGEGFYANRHNKSPDPSKTEAQPSSAGCCPCGKSNSACNKPLP